MRIIPQEWYYRTDKFVHSTLTWPEACIVIFITDMAEQNPPLSPRTAGVYVSGVRKFLQNNGVDTSFMNDSQYIRNTKAGLALWHRMTRNFHDADRERVPITADMIRGYYAYVGGQQPQLHQMATYSAAILGFTIVARVSEYLPTRDADHTLRTQHVTFYTTTGAAVPAHEVHLHPHAQVQAVSIWIKSKKNDQSGRGYKYHFNKANPGDTYCIATILWTYACRAAPEENNYFFHIPALQWTLKPPYFAQYLKRMGVHFGLDPARISSHSLRIGGATTLAAAGLTDNDVRNKGDWKSTAFARYLRKNMDLFERARSAMASHNAMTARNVLQMYAANPPKITTRH